MECSSVHLIATMMLITTKTVRTAGLADGGTTPATNRTSMESMETQITPMASIGITGKVFITP